jgi:hypothetical protein
MSRTHKYVAMQAYRGFQRPGGIGGQGSLGRHPPAWSKGGRGGFGPVSEFAYTGNSKGVSSNIRGIEWDPTGNSMLASYRIDRTVLNYVSTGPGVTDNWNVANRTSPNNYRYGFIPELASGGSCWSAIMTESPGGVKGGQLLLNNALGLNNNRIHVYTLPQPYELRQGNPPSSTGAPYYPTYTPVLLGNYNVGSVTTADQANALRMSPDGGTLVAMFSLSNPFIAQWKLSVPFDLLQPMVHTTKATVIGTSAFVTFVSPDGKWVYFTGAGIIYQHEMAIPWEISSINLTPTDSLSCVAQTGTTIHAIWLNEDHLYALGGNSTVFQYDV